MQKNILISGASTGIGRACAEHLASQGHRVYAGVRNLELKFEHKNIEPVILDVAKSEQIKSTIDSIDGLDVLINNAGIAVGGPLETVPVDSFKKQFEVNVFGVFELSKYCIQKLKESKSPLILNVSSVSGRFSSPFMGPYCASKHALEAMSDAYRRELKKFGIQVVLLEPGPIKTPIWDKSINASMKVGDIPTDSYEPELSNFLKYIGEEAQKGAEVSEVAKLVTNIVANPRPKARYLINGNWLLLTLFYLLPEKWVDVMLEKGITNRR